jgi:hypothetical protein
MVAGAGDSIVLDRGSRLGLKDAGHAWAGGEGVVPREGGRQVLLLRK